MTTGSKDYWHISFIPLYQAECLENVCKANLAACALELSKACEPEVLVQLIAFGVKGLPHRHVCRNSGPLPLIHTIMWRTEKKVKKSQAGDYKYMLDVRGVKEVCFNCTNLKQ